MTSLEAKARDAIDDAFVLFSDSLSVQIALENFIEIVAQERAALRYATKED